MDTIQTTGKAALTRPLKVLVPLIKDELEAGDNAGLEHYRKAGEMLIESQGQVEDGEWGGWLDRNFHLAKSTARRYMSLAKIDSVRLAHAPSMSAALYPDRPASHQPSWQPGVKQIAGRVNVTALASDARSKQAERELLRKLSHQLIDIGYKVLAAKLHPDKPGGSSEAMARLNSVRRLLKEAI